MHDTNVTTLIDCGSALRKSLLDKITRPDQDQIANASLQSYSSHTAKSQID